MNTAATNLPGPVFLHLWGITDKARYQSACKMLERFADIHPCPDEALLAGGISLTVQPAGGMPSGLPQALARTGLNTVWIAPPLDSDPFTTTITHLSSRTHVQACVDPVTLTCTGIHPIGIHPVEVERLVRTLLKVIKKLGAQVCDSQHQKMEMLRSRPWLFHAHHATSPKAFEEAAAMVRP